MLTFNSATYNRANYNGAGAIIAFLLTSLPLGLAIPLLTTDDALTVLSQADQVTILE